VQLLRKKLFVVVRGATFESALYNLHCSLENDGNAILNLEVQFLFSLFCFCLSFLILVGIKYNI
jgi:hypothetical protein